MKRFFAVLLVFTFVFSLFAQVNANDINITYIEQNSDLLSQAGSLLNVLEILPSKGDEELDTAVKRADFAVWTARMLRFNDYSVASERVFIDVPMDHWATYSINSLALLKNIISVPEDRLFHPDENITLAEAVKMMISSLDYQPVAEYKGGFPNGYMLCATDLGLLDGINIEGDFTLKDAKLLLYNTMLANIKQLNYFESGETTFLEKIWKIYKLSDYVTGVFGASVLGDKIYNNNEINIGGKKYKCSDGMYLNDLFGQYVTVYYTKNKDADEKNIILCFVDCDKSKTVTIEKHNFISYRDNKLNYIDESERKRSFNVDANVALVYNNALVSKGIENVVNGLEMGNLRLSDTDGNGKYDIIVMNDYYNLFVGGIDSLNKKVYDKLEQNKFIDLNEEKYENLRILTKDGSVASFDSIKENCVLSVFSSGESNGMGNYLTVIISYDSISGKINQYNKKHLIVDDTEIKISDSFYNDNQNKIVLGSAYTLYFDCNGNLTAMLQKAGDDMTLGYLIDYAVTKQEEVLLKIFTQKSEHLILQCDERIFVDRSRAKTSDEIINALKKGKEEIRGQLIRFSLVDDLIKKIDTLYSDGTDEFGLTLYADELPAKSRTVVDSGSYQKYGKDIICSKTAITFIVPTDDALVNADEDKFVIGGKKEVNTSSNTYTMSAYSLKKNAGFADVVLVKGDMDSERYLNTTMPILVTDLGEALNMDGDVVTQITGFRGQEEFEGNFKLGYTPDDEIGPGDLICVRVNGKNEIDKVKILYNYGENKDGIIGPKPIDGPLNEQNNTDLSWNYYIICGLANSLNDGVMALGKNAQEVVWREYVGSAPLIIYNSKAIGKSKIDLSTVNSIQTGVEKRVVIVKQSGNVSCLYAWQ